MTAAITPSAPFQAEWPKELNPALKSSIEKIRKIFWDIISIVIFPIGLTRLLGCYLRNLSYRLTVPGKLRDVEEPLTAWKLALEAIRLIWNPESHKVDCTEEGKELLNRLGGEEVWIKAPDGARIHGGYFPGRYEKKVILCAGGNGSQWETQKLTEILRPLGTSLFAINSRGVGKSEGTRCEKGYALDYYAAYEWLIQEKGVDPEDIVLVGFSMGAALGTKGADLVQNKYLDKGIKAINICSFSSVRKVVTEHLKALPLAAKIANIGMKWIGFNISVEAAWRRLRGTKCLFFNAIDEIIPFNASLAKVAALGSHAVQMHSLRNHNRPLTSDEKHTLFAQIREMLQLSSLYDSVMGLARKTLPVQTVGEIG